MDTKLIQEVVAALSKASLTPEHAHMLKPWEMVFGGLLLPVMAESDPKVKEDKRYAKLTAKYSKEKVEAFFAVREVEVKVEVPGPEKVVEVEVIKEVAGQTVVVNGGRTPTLHSPVKMEGKFRRLKDKVAKVARKKHSLTKEARDAMNIWWNGNQRLTDTGDCQPVVDAINAKHGTDLSPSQFGGWISLLTRFVTKYSKAERIIRLASMEKRGFFTVMPEYTDAFTVAIMDNWEAERREEDIRAKAKKQMRDEAGGATASTVQPSTPAATPASQGAPQAAGQAPAPEAPTVEPTPVIETEQTAAPEEAAPLATDIDLGDIAFG